MIKGHVAPNDSLFNQRISSFQLTDLMLRVHSNQAIPPQIFRGTLPDHEGLWASDPSHEDLQSPHYSRPRHVVEQTAADAILLPASDPFQPIEGPQLQQSPHYFESRLIAGRVRAGLIGERSNFQADAETPNAAAGSLKLDGLRESIPAPLELGATGEEVKGLQLALRALGYLRSGPMGTFDAEGVMEHKTVTALLRWARSKSVP